jgi:acetyl esterase/lipase
VSTTGYWPEHPFPAALEDTVAACRWLRQEGFEPSRLLIAGSSSGAALALGAAMELRDGGEPPPAGLAMGGLLVQAGDAELLLDDARNLAQRAGDAGVDMTLDLWPATFHNWQL